MVSSQFKRFSKGNPEIGQIDVEDDEYEMSITFNPDKPLQTPIQSEVLVQSLKFHLCKIT